MQIMTNNLDISYVSLTTMDVTDREWMYHYIDLDDSLILTKPHRSSTW